MEKFIKIASLRDEIQARLVDAELSSREIPHIIRSYHETAFDGLFQGQLGWGHVEGPEDMKDLIKQIVYDLSKEVD